MSRASVLALIPLPRPAREAIEARYELCLAPDLNSDEAIGRFRESGVRAVVTNGSVGLTAAQMERLPKLEIICAFGAGHENIDSAAAGARGIVVTHAPGANDATVADHALGLMLALARGFTLLDPAVRRGEWNSARTERPTLNGGRLGLVGLGRIGAKIAVRAAAFDMHVSYLTRHPRADLPWQHYTDVEQLARDSDFLVLACPGGAATRHLVDARVLAALGPKGVLVNISRGSVVDTAALIAALEAGSIAGAGLDVFEAEPDLPAALLACRNTVLTPHIAGRSPAAIAAQTDMLLGSLAAHFEEGKAPFAVA
ncbi:MULTISPECIES: 2-hydroxyacid dehydrogenase [Polaromonas]|uniref:2-hydroxyacid dehydrogenase n=1 Tax=Polaromonas aquatica TaxID=332657 RepID=A0ABW1TY10_9BURK